MLHTFVTTVTLTNGAPLETVSLLLVHSRVSTTQTYTKAIERKVNEDIKLFSKKLISSNTFKNLIIFYKKKFRFLLLF